MRSVLITVILLFMALDASSRTPLSPSRLEQLSGVRTTNDTKHVWDKKYGKTVYIYGKRPSKFLSENYKILPSAGTVLDIGIGEGRNAVFLARMGFDVTGIDISTVAIKKSHLLAKEHGVKLKTILGDLKKYKFTKNRFDIILCFYLVDRDLNRRLVEWIKPGGFLIYEAHTLKQQKYEGGKDSYYLKEQELLRMFPGFQVVKFEEPLSGKKFRSSIILRKSAKK